MLFFNSHLLYHKNTPIEGLRRSMVLTCHNDFLNIIKKQKLRVSNIEENEDKNNDDNKEEKINNNFKKLKKN